MASTVNFTASAVSLEGKTLWIIKSLPVSYGDALKAKINLQVYLSIPPLLLAGIVASVLFSLPSFKILLLLLVLMLYARLSANLSLVANLQFPKLEWINETQAVKQSVSVLISMLYSSLVVLLPGALYYLVFAGKSFGQEFLAGYALLLLLGWRLTDRLILGWGVSRFEQLG